MDTYRKNTIGGQRQNLEWCNCELKSSKDGSQLPVVKKRQGRSLPCLTLESSEGADVFSSYERVNFCSSKPPSLWYIFNSRPRKLIQMALPNPAAGRKRTSFPKEAFLALNLKGSIRLHLAKDWGEGRVYSNGENMWHQAEVRLQC